MDRNTGTQWPKASICHQPRQVSSSGLGAALAQPPAQEARPSGHPSQTGRQREHGRPALLARPRALTLEAGALAGPSFPGSEPSPFDSGSRSSQAVSSFPGWPLLAEEFGPASFWGRPLPLTGWGVPQSLPSGRTPPRVGSWGAGRPSGVVTTRGATLARPSC